MGVSLNIFKFFGIKYTNYLHILYSFTIRISIFIYLSPTVTLTNKKKMSLTSQTQPPQHCPSDLQHLQQQYPGITKIGKKLNLVCRKKIGILAQLIRYNVPPAYYPKEIMVVDGIIQDLYYEYLGRDRGMDGDSEEEDSLPAQMMRKASPISDEEQAQVILQCQRELSQALLRPTIQDIQNFVAGFNKNTDSDNVNQILINTVREFGGYRTEKGFLENFMNRDSKNGEKERNRNGYQKYPSKNSQISQKTQKTQKNESKKQPIVLIIGANISPQVKQMRNYVKKASNDSFAIMSLRLEQNKPQLEKQKTQISLSLNKVSKQNLSDIFRDILPLIVKSEELATTFVMELLEKCITQYRMAQMYLQFVRMFTKIPPGCFLWQWSGLGERVYKENNINGVHRILVEKLEGLFKEEVNRDGAKTRLKHITRIMGTLIRYQKLSRKVYIEATNTILSKVFQTSTPNPQTQQNHLQSFLTLIESLSTAYTKNWSDAPLSQLLTPSNYEKVIKYLKFDIEDSQEMEPMEEMLLGLCEFCRFGTLRVRCLVQNLYQRNGKESVAEPVVAEQQETEQEDQALLIKRNTVKELLEQQDGMQALITLYSQHRTAKNLTTILLTLFDNTRPQIFAHLPKFYTQISLTLTPSQLKQYWHLEYMHFVYGECDMPFMIEGLVWLMRQFDGDVDEWVVEGEGVEQEDREDLEGFMSKFRRMF